MKRFLSMLATGAVAGMLALGLSTSASAQTRGIGAGALVLDDNYGHTLTVETPQNPSAEWSAWSAGGFQNLWILPVPPSSGAQAGFIYSGPLSGAIIPHLAYWIPPGATGYSGRTGGFTGAWDYATKGQLGIPSLGGVLAANENVITDGAGNLITQANGGTNMVLHGTTPPGYSAVANADLVYSTITSTSTGSTLTAPGSVALGGSGDFEINLANANAWTAQQTFTDATANAAAASFNNTNSGAGTNIGATVAATGASTGTNDGLTFNVGNAATSNNDIVGTGNSWHVTNGGVATFANIGGAYYANAAVTPYTIPSDANVVDITGTTISLTLPTEVDGKAIRIYNGSSNPTTGGIVIPVGGLFTIVGVGGAWEIATN